MHQTMVVALGMFTFGAAQGAFAADCPTAYDKTIPYSQPVVDDQTTLDFHNSVNLHYDCQSFLLSTEGALRVQFFGIEADLISAKVSTDNKRDSSHLTSSILALGYEIAHEERDLRDLYSETFRPDQDLDVSQVKNLQLGPLSVPVRYGIHGSAEANVKVLMHDLGSDLVVTPAAKTTAYVLASLDVQIIQASARGQLLLVDGHLANSLGVHFSPSVEAPTVAFTAAGDLNLQGLDGSVTASITHPDENGKTAHEEANLFHWNGVSQEQQVYQHAEEIAALPARDGLAD